MLHLAVLFICTYLAPIKINGAASFCIMIQLTHFPLFFPLSSLFLSLLSRFSELEANTGIIEKLIASRIHLYYSYVRTLHTAKQRSCEFSCYDSTNSFPSLFSCSKYITLWYWTESSVECV